MLAKIHSPCTMRERGQKRSGPRGAHVTSIRLSGSRFETRVRIYGLVNRPVFDHELLNFGESRRYLNFKSANVYFCHTVPLSLSLSLLIVFSTSFYLSVSLFPSYRPAFPGRFEFQILCDRYVGHCRRGNNRLSSLSTRLCAVICCRRPPTWYIRTDTNRDLHGAVSLASRTFIYGATRYVSELIL